MEIKEIGAYAQKINDNISRVLIGKKDEIDLILVSLFAGGHALLDDVPGTGKTVLAKSLAKSVQCDFKRIQFTADLLPSDITGLSVYNQKTGEFDFQPGPAFTNILLADEINRTTPRTQSALLECMEEKQITVDGETKPLGAPFFVIATQNPVESSGTFALPEAQLDRFFMKLSLGYPNAEQERAMLTAYREKSPLDDLSPVCSGRDILKAQAQVAKIRVSQPVAAYIVSLANATRQQDEIRLGLSPRGVIALMRASQAKAAVQGREYVLPDDVKAVFVDVSAHRVICRGYQMGQADAAAKESLGGILARTPSPVEQQ